MQDHEMVSRWQDWMRAEGRSPNTIREYRYALQRLASELDPPSPLAEVTEQDIVVFMARLGKRAHSKQLYLRGFKSFYGWAHARGLVETDPTAHIRPKAPPERDPDAYSPEEVVALMDAAGTRSERDALAILLCYSLGLRRSEVCKLAPDDIDWNGRRVLVRDSKGGKTRWVEMNAAAGGALDGLRPWWNGTVLGGVDPQWFTMIVNRAARESGLPPERRKAHMLRSAFATNLMNEGADVTVVSKLLGHSRVSTTMRYRKIRDRDRRAAVDMLPVPGVR